MYIKQYYCHQSLILLYRVRKHGYNVNGALWWLHFYVYGLLFGGLFVFFRVLTMSFHVFAEVVTAHEAFVTYGTCEPFLARVRFKMALQFVRAGESLTTEEPVTDEGSLACVPAEMSLEMGGLVVHLPTAGDVTAVDVPLSQVVAGRAVAVCFLAVRAVAVGAAGVTTGGSGGDGGYAREKGGGQGAGQLRLGGGDDPLVRLTCARGEQGAVGPQGAEILRATVVAQLSRYPCTHSSV